MKDKEVFETKDKQLVPFLLTQQDISFIGTKLIGSLLYFQFTPLDKCHQLIVDFATRKAPLVQPKDILEAVETFRDMVFEMKEKNRGYGKP
ncbi:hypothetical protein HY384_04240 [Candidatus Daviesbacteria bacterium]|nr:hypothetical protein [Candidatus Daviesbacteria bacterium]